MKYLLFILLLASCSKEETPTNKKCYSCVFMQSVAQVQLPPRDVCIDPWEKMEEKVFEDQYGNDVGFICKEK